MILSNYQDDISAVLHFLEEDLDVSVVFDSDELNAYWHNGRGTVSVSTKQSRRLQLYSILHEAGHAVIREREGYEAIFPYGKKYENKSIARRVDVIREEVMAWEEGRKLAIQLGIDIDIKLWHNFVKKNLFDYVRWAYDPKAFYAHR
mgnify:CR=1 FL=1